MKKFIPMLLASSVVGLGGCGGGGGTDTTTSSGGGSSTVAGLDMPVTLSVVTPKETTSARQVAALKMNYAAVIAALNSTSSDFSTDPQNMWVHDRALEPLDEVNNILCYIGQTGADQLVNKTYTALVDSAKCERQGDSGGGQNQSSGGGKTVELEKWVVASTRVDNNSSQFVRIWAPSGDNGGGKGPQTEIRAEVEISEGVSATNPFGKFTLNFAAIAAADWTDTMDSTRSVTKGQVLESGTLKTVDAINGKIGFTMYQGSSLFGQERQVSVVTDTDQSTGVALTGGSEMDYSTMPPTATSKAFAVAFNPANILVLRDAAVADLPSVVSISEGGTVGSSQPAACLSRTEFHRNVWRYNLYNAADGSRVALNSGFPFQWDSDANGSNDSFGYVSYWGIWSEKEPTAGWNGATIAKEQYGQSGATQSYTVVESPGKLIKSEKSSIALTQLDGETFNYWDNSNGMQYRVEYDIGTGTGGGTVSTGSTGGTTAGFYKTHELVFNPNSPPTETALTPPVLIDTSVQQWLGMYSQTLGGQVNYNSMTDPNNITFFKESNVDGNDAAFSSASTVDFDCFTRCLKPGLTATQYENVNNWSIASGATDSPYYADATNPMSGNAVPAATYRFDKTTLALTVVSTATNGTTDADKVVKVVSSYAYDSLTATNPEPWGINTNAMVPTGTALTNIYDTWGQAVSYRWETGHKSWNKVVRVKDSSGAQVAFDKPLNISYKHATANDANPQLDGSGNVLPSSYDGKNVMMQYGGNGDLWGIPWVDPTTGKECMNNPQDCRPAFALKDGTLMGASNEYAVKAIDMELSPVVAAGACSALVLNQPAAPLPTAKSGDPSNVATDAPTPTDPAPAVIGGVVQ